VPRVLVDATAVPADRAGVGRYVDGLIPALAAAGANLAVACQRADVERYFRLAPDAQVVGGPPAISHRTARLAWEQTGLPAVAEEVGADLIHSPFYTLPLRADVPVVVTIHDVSSFTLESRRATARGTFYRSATRTALRRSARCIVPSKATRDELVRVLSADPTLLDVAPHGVDASIFRIPTELEVERVRTRLGLADGGGYVAFLGALDPRRNVPHLVRAYALACADREDPPALVLAGGADADDEVAAALATVPPHLRVLRPGYLRYDALRGYLGGATVVAYPSSGEGFGFPVLEAMACGAAVLTANTLSLPEVGGDAVAYSETDVPSLTASLSSLLDDAVRREQLGAAAHERSLQFTWEASAHAHLQTYERALEAP
jgi:glycosyltransferase involved in cell wall biosynthesis